MIQLPTKEISVKSYYSEADYDATALEAARLVLPFLVNRYHPASIIDVGCGQGEWLAEAKRLGVSDVTGIDGPHVEKLAISPEEFVVADLREQFPRFSRFFGMALCLEVAEHLPVELAEDFVGYLKGLSKTIIFSAAIPGQGGVGHVNCQWQVWWAEKFARRGYRALDWLRREIWSDSRIQPFYRQNIIVFEYQPDCPYSTFQDAVHPDFYTYQMQVHRIFGNGI
jgi:SAM-dependent methyltransferase